MEVESYPKWKETNIGDTPIFHWTMIMGGRVVFAVNLMVYYSKLIPRLELLFQIRGFLERINHQP